MELVQRAAPGMIPSLLLSILRYALRLVAQSTKQSIDAALYNSTHTVNVEQLQQKIIYTSDTKQIGHT